MLDYSGGNYMRYIMRLNGDFVLREDGKVYQYDEIELGDVISTLLREGRVETIIIHKHDSVI